MTWTKLWRRLDTPGHDAALLEEVAKGWRLTGTALFRHEGMPAHLTYTVLCDAGWATTRGEVHGWLGGRAVHHVVERAAGGGWTLDGKRIPGVGSYVDLDLGFTPATNLLQLRRVGLGVGEAAEIPVAWLDVEGGGPLTALPQRYHRRSATEYAYEAPSTGYAGVLELDAAGFIRRYPGMWEAE